MKIWTKRDKRESYRYWYSNDNGNGNDTQLQNYIYTLEISYWQCWEFMLCYN